MLCDAPSYKDVLIRYAIEHSCMCPTNDEWKKVEIILKFLEIFLDATKIYSISNLYLKEVWKIRVVLMDASAYSDEILKQLKNEMQSLTNIDVGVIIY